VQQCSQLTGVTDLGSHGVGFGVAGLSRSDPPSDVSLPKLGVGLWWGRDDWLLITVLGVVVVEFESDSPPGLVTSSLSFTKDSDKWLSGARYIHLWHSESAEVWWGTIHTRQLQPHYFHSCNTISADDSRRYTSNRIHGTVQLGVALLTEIQLSQEVHDITTRGI